MVVSDFRVKLSRTPGEQGDLADAHAALWRGILAFAESYRGPTQDRLEALRPPVMAQLAGEGAELIVVIPKDHPDAEAIQAGLRVILAADLDHLSSEVARTNWWLEAPRESLPEVLAASREALGESSALVTMLTPDPTFLGHLMGLLSAHQTDSDDLAHLNTVAWYLRNTAAPPADAVEQILEVCERTTARGAAKQGAQLVRQLSGRVDLSAVLRGRLLSDHLVARGFALAGLATLVEQGSVSASMAVDYLVSGISMGGFAAEIAAEEASQVLAKEDIDGLRKVHDALVELLIQDDLDDEVRHAGLLALVNLFLHRDAIPEGLITLIDIHLDAPGSMAGLAQWALQVFEERPALPWSELGASS